jgi:hypothetical protein
MENLHGKRIQKMIDFLVNKLFWWTPLREAIFAEVHFYDEIESALKEPTTNLTWEEGGLWYGYTFNEMHNTYLFDDIGYETMTELWDNLWTRDMEWGLMYK